MSAPWFFPFPVWLVPTAVIGLLLSLRQLSRWIEPKVYLTAVESLLTPAELRFYRTLRRAVPEDHLILTKVRIADLIEVSSSHPPSRQRVFRSIASKHVDFVLVQSANLKPVAAVELDDSSHRQSHRRKRDELVDEVFGGAGLPLVRIKAAPHYSSREVASAIEAIFS